MKITVTRTITEAGRTISKTAEADLDQAEFWSCVAESKAEAERRVELERRDITALTRCLFDSLDKSDPPSAEPKAYPRGRTYYAVWLKGPHHPPRAPAALFCAEQDAAYWARQYEDAIVQPFTL